MSMSVVDMIESTAGGDGQNHKEDVNTKETAEENGDSSRAGEVKEMETETGKGGNSGRDSGSGLAVTEAGKHDENPQKN